MTADEPHTDLRHFSFRELFAQRALAQKAFRRGRNPEAAKALIAAIDAALEARRERVFAKRSSNTSGPKH